MDYELKYQKRKTVSISVVEGVVLVKAPKGFPIAKIEALLSRHKRWIDKRLNISKSEADKRALLTDQDVLKLKTDAEKYFTEETRLWADKMGVVYTKITITSARKRFGSCSSNGGICFSYRLMLYPPEARTYVIVHELCHLVHMNHSKKFYELVGKYLPDYKERKKLLGV